MKPSVPALRWAFHHEISSRISSNPLQPKYSSPPTHSPESGPDGCNASNICCEALHIDHLGFRE
ncbi:hypothetical protein BDR05DRAFT_957833 [Suillus weaverae]|nr:hypothetical protein BDR05DRAFT_957833 [Suillus weaverae]